MYQYLYSLVANFEMRLILISTVLSITFSCTPNTEQDNWGEEIEIEKMKVLNLHDTLMLEMKDVSNLLKLLETATLDSGLDQQSKEPYDLAIVKLRNADKDMWDWMHNFDVAFQDEEDSITLVYFENQFMKIDSVRVLFESSLLNGEELISKLGNNSFP